MHALPPVSGDQEYRSSTTGAQTAGMPSASLKTAAAGLQLTATSPPTPLSSPLTTMHIHLSRSFEFPIDNPTETKIIKEKEINASANKAEIIEQKMNSTKMEEVFPTDLNFEVDTQNVKKAFSSVKSFALKRLGNSKPASGPTPVVLTAQQKSQLAKSIALVFNCDLRSVERLSLPLEDLLEPIQDSAPDPDHILSISLKAMESCILPCLEAFAPDHPIPIDFAFCVLEKNALIPLLKKICLAPNNPTIRIARDLSDAEKKAMDQRIIAQCSHLPLTESFSGDARNVKWYHEAKEQSLLQKSSQIELERAKREMQNQRASIYKNSIKTCFEPIYYVKKISRKSDDTIQFEETYQHVCLIKTENGRDRCELHTNTLTSSFHYTVGKLQLELQVFKRLSLEHHPARLAQSQSSPAPTAKSSEPSLQRKPLPPVPKGKATLPQMQPEAPSHLSWKEKGDFYLDRKLFVKAFEAFSQALSEAEEAQQSHLIVGCLTDLGRVDIEQGEWIRGAKLLNGALALCPVDHPERQNILNLMMELDKRYLKTVCGFSDAQLARHPGPNTYLQRREQLQEQRKFSKSKDNRAEETVKTFTQDLNLFIKKMFEECFALFDNPNFAYALISLGSFGRKEMCFCSDLEFAALIANNSTANVDWFCKVFTYFELQMIHLGETEFPILRGKRSATKAGLCYDQGGNTPLGKTDRKKPLLDQRAALLIKTPQDMANLQSPTNSQQDMILTNALKSAGFIMGSPTLYDQYMQGMNSILNGLNPKDTLSIRKRRALELIDGHLPEFKPDVSMRKQNLPAFNVKAELCRLPIFLIQGLGEFLGIDATNTWDKLQELQEKGFSQKGIDNLRKAISYALLLRLRLHNFYGYECDVAYHPSMKATPEKRDPDVTNPYYLSKDEMLQIIFIYRVLFPLHRAFYNFKQTTNLEELKKQIFFDQTLFTQWELQEQAQPNFLRIPAISIPAPSALTTPQATPAVRPRVIQSLAQACGTSEERIQTSLPGLDQCPCYSSTTIQHGFYQDCLLTNEFVENSLIPFIKKQQVKELDLLSCQPGPDAMIALMRHWDELSIEKLILPRTLTIPETNAYLEKAGDDEEKQNARLSAFAKVFEIHLNPYAIDEAFLDVVGQRLDDREAGPFSKSPTSLFKLKTKIFEYQPWIQQFRIAFSIDSITQPLGRPIPGMPKLEMPTVMNKRIYNPSQKLDWKPIVQNIVDSFAYALNEGPGFLKFFENVECCLCYGYDVVDPFSGFHRACGLTSESMEKCLIPLAKRFFKKQLDLTLLQPEPDALIPLIKAWPSLNLSLLILPRPLTVGEWSEFQKLPNCPPVSALHVRVNPYYADISWSSRIQSMRQSKKVGPQSATPNALIDLTVTSMKIGPDTLLHCTYEEGIALPHRNDFPLPGYSSTLNRSDASFHPSKQINSGDYRLKLHLDIVKGEEALKLSRESPAIYSMAALERKMAKATPPLGKVVETPKVPSDREPIREGK